MNKKMNKCICSMAMAALLMSTMTGCSSKNTSGNNNSNHEVSDSQTSNDTENTTTGFTAGTYTATADGNNGPVKVEVTVSDSAIENIQVTESGETAGLGDVAMDSLIEKVLNTQSIGIDTVTGATNSSNALLSAVEDCLTQAGGDLEALKTVVEKDGVDEEMSTGIVVVGGGASGTAAALQAVEDGANVILVEMTTAPQGQGTQAGGLFATHSTQQIEQGQEVDNKWVYDQFVDTSNYVANGSLISKVIKNSGDTVDWLIENGCELILAHPGTGGVYEHTYTQPASTIHGYVEGGTKGITALHETITQNGGTVLYNTKATELIMENGKAVGIKAEKEDGGVLTIKADSVILATGGFGGNEAMVAETFGDGFGTSRIATNIGTGIDMAISAGAAASYDDAIMMHYGVGRQGLTAFDTLNAALSYPLLYVDVDGNRFLNEESFSLEPIKASDAVKGLPQATAYEIFDQTVIDIVAKEGTAGLIDLYSGVLATDPTVFIECGHEVDSSTRYEQSHTPEDLTDVLADHIEAGNIIEADSIEELEEKLGMSHLADTISRYNELCDAGEDDDHFKSAQYLDKLEGKLYAVKVTPAVFLGTLGGIDINDNCEVLNEEGKAIPGLYAVGAETNGAYGNSYVYFEGGTLGYAYGTGRIAGQAAANAVSDK